MEGVGTCPPMHSPAMNRIVNSEYGPAFSACVLKKMLDDIGLFLKNEVSILQLAGGWGLSGLSGSRAPLGLRIWVVGVGPNDAQPRHEPHREQRIRPCIQELRVRG